MPHRKPPSRAISFKGQKRNKSTMNGFNDPDNCLLIKNYYPFKAAIYNTELLIKRKNNAPHS